MWLIEEDRMNSIKSIKPVRLNEVVSSNDSSPISNVDNLGRSNEFDQINQTSQSQ